MLTSDFHFHGLCSPGQDPHLNRFFQQCQKRELDLSLPPTSNFLNCLKVRESSELLSILLIYFDCNKTKTLTAEHYFMSNQCSDVSSSKSIFIFFFCIHFHPSPPPIPTCLLQGLLSMERIPVIIRFLPVLFNQLFKVLTQNDNDEVTTATTR